MCWLTTLSKARLLIYENCNMQSVCLSCAEVLAVPCGLVPLATEATMVQRLGAWQFFRLDVFLLLSHKS